MRKALLQNHLVILNDISTKMSVSDSNPPVRSSANGANRREKVKQCLIGTDGER
ncbi:MAG: hypothetical protein LW863_13095 [Flammeovirgaceae bacterium]|nr:hypothetical protein [Flammeovirgaceae bacterium]